MLPYLEPDVFRRNPKIFVGYSDITALHLWLMRRSGLRTFHGPTVDDLIPSVRDPTMASLLTALTTPCPTDEHRPRTRARRACRGERVRAAHRRQPVAGAADDRHAVRGRYARRDPLPRGDARSDVRRRRAARASARGGAAARGARHRFGQLSLDRSEEDEFENFLLDLLVGSRRARAHGLSRRSRECRI